MNIANTRTTLICVWLSVVPADADITNAGSHNNINTKTDIRINTNTTYIGIQILIPKLHQYKYKH